MQFKPVVLLGSVLAFMGCATTENPTEFTVNERYTPEVIVLAKPIEMKWQPKNARVENIRTYSKTITRTTTSNQIRTEREELVDFTVKSKVTKVDPKTQDRYVLLETIRKDGPVDLYDLGYPELGETIDFVYATNAKVKRAGRFPPNSLFFIPPLSIPKRAVSVGDTWDLKVNWVSLRNGLPLELELISILKNVYKCGKSDRCLEIELSGVISLPEQLNGGAQMQSSLVGRVLFNVDQSSIVWSDIRNKESLKVEGDKMEILSCTETILEEPGTDRWPWRSVVECDPNKTLAEVVPGVRK